ITAHPLQPFSPRYFRGDDRLFSHSEGHCAGARALRSERADGEPAFLSSPLPDLDDGELALSLDDLVAFFRQPAVHLMRRRIGVQAAADVPPPEDHEPLELDSLDAYHVRTALLDRTLAKVDADEAFDRARAEGLLPLGTPGRSQFDQALGEVESFVDEIEGLRRGAPLDPVDVDIRCGDARITGHLGDLWPAGRLAYTTGRIAAKHRLALWIRHLALNANAAPLAPRNSVLLGRDQGRGVDRIDLRPVADATALLADLVALYRIGLRRPLAFFPRAACAYVMELRARDGQPDAGTRAMNAAYGQWRATKRGSPGESGVPAVARLFADADPLAADPDGELGFRTLARRVFEPLLDASE
ncbi:MAG: hypothetical protein QGH45_12510, partial [Myxococcota bacterium]|nr:hypothetical protein [Myxococcota bacterium]